MREAPRLILGRKHQGASRKSLETELLKLHLS